MPSNITVPIDIVSGNGSGAATVEKQLKSIEAQARKTAAVFRALTASVNTSQSSGIGANIVSGIERGLSASGGAVAAITKITQNIIAVAKRVLGIRSPSAVFFAIGQQIVAGLQGGLQGGAARVQGAISNLLNNSFFGNLAANAVAQLTGLLKQGASAWLDYSSNLEQARIGMITMTGSVTVADKHLRDLQNFAAKTPFEFSELVSASRKLQGVGISAEKIIPILKDVGNSLSAAGRISELPFATKALGDIEAKGKLQGQEIIQLANAGIPAIKILSAELNKSSAEILKMGEEGKITSQIFFEALRKYSQANFGDAMEKQSRTFQGAMSNITDSLYQSSQVAFAPFYEKISALANELAANVSSHSNDFEAVGRDIANAIGKGFGMATVEVGSQMGKALAEKISGGKKSYFQEIDESFTNEIRKAAEDAMMNRTLPIFNLSQEDADKLRKSKETEKEFELLNQRIENARQRALSGQKPMTGIADLRRADDTNTRPAIKPVVIDQEASRAAEVARKIELIKLGQNYKVSEALQKSHLTFTAEQELESVKKLNALDQTYVKNQLKLQSDSYTSQIKLVQGDKEQSTKLTAEKNEIIAKLSGELKINEINNAKEVAVFEQRILNERRAALIDLKNIQIKENSFNLNNQSFDIERAISRSVGDAEKGYNELIALTTQSYKTISRLTLDSYQEQLKNQSLTKEQRFNLTTEMYLSERQLAEDNRRAILSIEEKKVEGVLNQIRRQTDRRTQFFRNQQESANVFSSIVGLDVPQSGFLKNIIEGANQAAISLESGLKQRFREITEEITNGKNKLSELTEEGEKAETSGKIAGLKTQLEGVNFELDNLQNGYPKAQKEILGLFDSLTKGTSKYTVFDEIIQKNYEAERALERSVLVTEISGLKREFDTTKRFVDSGIVAPKELAPKEDAYRAGEQRLKSFDLATQIGNVNLQTRANLLEKIKALQTGDKAALASIEFQSDISMLKEKFQLQAENIALENGYYKNSELLALQRKNKLLNFEREIFETRNELSQKGVFSQTEADAKVLDFLNQNTKSLTDLYADTKIGVIETFWDGLGSGIDKATSKLDIFGNIISQVLKDLLKFATLKLLGMGGGGTTGGFNIGSILGIGGQGAIGGTPSFNPASANGGGIGSLLGGNSPVGSIGGGLLKKIPFLGKLFNTGTAAATGTVAATAASGFGTVAGAGFAMNGTAAGAMGLLPSAAPATGGGMAAFGSLMTNPITLGILGAAVGGFLLYKYFNRNKSEKKLKKAAFDQYSLRVEDMATLKSLKQIGESTLGKGIASKDEGAKQVVALDSSQELLREYAAKTNQKSAKLDAAYISDPNAKENQFTSKFGGFREFGGSVRAGYSYIVGERRPELFTPSVSGHISPSVPNMDSKMFPMMARMMDNIAAVLGDLTERMNGISYGEIVAVGASSASREIAGAFISETNNNARLTSDLSRGTGNYT